ncbi:putative helicase [Tetrabaena socialis]|uniref:DNA-directed primase/polymerase protein n=1 Tax=Tetrabaena socialis TaxID=47790 RepID=A0A2J7ZMU5_9CHLO|nr:putative helicase [Tetrabaena socialis]|eukprot:PNH01594.1 putative helicase [Tetrabaena socialis]
MSRLKKGSAELHPLTILGTTWHRGHGAKDRMQSLAARTGAACQVQLQDPDSGSRHFGCYETWDVALVNLKRLRGQRRHLFEIITHGAPCKPYLDIDGHVMPAGIESMQELVAHADRLIIAIFAADYGIALSTNDLLWLVSPNPDKISLHLVVATHAPQWLYSSNHQSDPSGASHLAMRIVQQDPDVLGPMVDIGVYTKDREMRAIGASKFGKPGGVLTLFQREGEAGQVKPADALITNLDPPSERKLIPVPLHIPRVVRTERRALRTPREAAERDPEENSAEVVTRMLDLLRTRLHPSAYHDRTHGAEDAYDTSRGIKFNYTDRNEPCYSGRVHDGAQNLRCYIDAAGDIYAKCFSVNCAAAAAHRIGPLRAESDAFLASAIRVDIPFMQLNVDDGHDMDGDIGVFNAAVQRWLRGDARVLSIRSPMGTGKTTFLDDLLTSLDSARPSVLIVTYRQSLASEHARKMRSHGLVSYLDVGHDQDLTDRTLFPRVICQIESLGRLSGASRLVPDFDIIVLDEVESVLRHYASPTVTSPLFAMDAFMIMLRHARRGIITLDATWGAATHEVLSKANLSNILVVNTRRPTSPRKFSFTNDEDSWVTQILEDLAAGINVVVVTLSAEKAYAIRTLAIDRGAVDEDRIILHTSKTADDVKKQLSDVDALWSRHQLVIYSPTIAAGVDFSSEHFGRMYFYACAQSALPSTALQMLFRVRKITDPTVRCCAARTMRLATTAAVAPLTSRDMWSWLMWMEMSQRPRDISGVDTPVQAQALAREVPGQPQKRSSVMAPPQSFWFKILSYVEAERQNAHVQFLHQFALLADAAGHAVCISHIKEERVPQGTQALAARMLEVESLPTTAREVEEAEARIMANNASEEDKWLCYVAAYKKGWSLDRIDAAFLAAHGTQCTSGHATLLARVLCPELRRPHEADVPLAERANILKIPLVDETLRALGLASPFDTTIIADLAVTFRDRLAATEMFRNYPTTARLFNNNGRTTTPVAEWDLNTIAKAVNMVLGAVGLALVGQEARKQTKGLRQSRMTNYHLAADTVDEMLELTKLRLRRSGLAPSNEHARALLDACTLPRYGHLIDVDSC